MSQMNHFTARSCLAVLPALLAGWLAGTGCWSVPSAHTQSKDYRLGDAPVDPPGSGQSSSAESVAAGGRLFKLYCSSCHNARPLGERPFSNSEVAMAHMREQAYLTGDEYRKLIHFMRRWHDVGPPTVEPDPSPKRFYFSQPIPELQKKADAEEKPVPPAGATPSGR